MFELNLQHRMQQEAPAEGHHLGAWLLGIGGLSLPFDWKHHLPSPDQPRKQQFLRWDPTGAGPFAPSEKYQP